MQDAATRRRLVADEAEDLAQLWGTRAGFTVNPVRRDRHGWDHLFEMSLPRASRSSDPLGLPISAFTCRVQVKAVSINRPSISIKLTNWHRAIKDPLPWFFLVLRYHRRRLREAVLAHIDQRQVERVLARLFALPDAAKAQLHKKTLTLKCDAAVTLDRPFHKSLSTALAAAVGRDPFEYAKAKQAWYENAGYTDRRELQIRMTLGPHEQDELFKRLARAAIGLDDGLKSSEASLFRERFGTEEHLEIRGRNHARIQLGDIGRREVMLSILDPDGSHRATLPVSMRFSASVFPMLPRNFWSFRFQSPVIDMVLDVGTLRATINLNIPENDTPVPLKVLHDNLAFLKCLCDREGEDVELCLSRGPITATLTSLEAPVLLGRRGYELATNVEALWELCCHLGAADDEIQFTPSEIASLSRAASIMLASRTGADQSFFIDTTVTRSEVDLSEPLTIVTSPRVRIGATTFIDLVAFAAVPTVLSEKNGEVCVRVSPQRCQLLLSRRYVGSNVERFNFQRAALGTEAELTKAGHRYIFGFDWHQLTNNATP